MRYVRTPDPAGTGRQDDQELNGIACTSTHDCWAVGFYGSTPTHHPETLHWNGTAGPEYRGDRQRGVRTYLMCVRPGASTARTCSR